MSWASPFRIADAVRHLRQGGVLAYPTESVYGLGCNPNFSDAVQFIGQLKGRRAGKTFLLIASEFSQVEPWVAPLTRVQRDSLLERWPGPVTWVVPASDLAPRWLVAGDNTIAIRVTAHPLAKSLCRACGSALVSTSANPAGMPAARTSLKVRCYFGSESIKILAGPVGANSKPSAIYELISGKRLR
jgi:L-threonylcarbamoyladenylate synthase